MLADLAPGAAGQPVDLTSTLTDIALMQQRGVTGPAPAQAGGDAQQPAQVGGGEGGVVRGY